MSLHVFLRGCSEMFLFPAYIIIEVSQASFVFWQEIRVLNKVGVNALL